jgi:hypothetical protein
MVVLVHSRSASAENLCTVDIDPDGVIFDAYPVLSAVQVSVISLLIDGTHNS